MIKLGQMVLKGFNWVHNDTHNDRIFGQKLWILTS